MMSRWNVRFGALAVSIALVLAFGAGSVFAKKPEQDGTLVLTVFEVDTVIDEDYTVEVTDDGVFAVLRTQSQRSDVRLRIQGGAGLVNRGVLSDGDEVRVAGSDKKHKHRGHVTILK